MSTGNPNAATDLISFELKREVWQFDIKARTLLKPNWNPLNSTSNYDFDCGVKFSLRLQK